MFFISITLYNAYDLKIVRTLRVILIMFITREVIVSYDGLHLWMASACDTSIERISA